MTMADDDLEKLIELLRLEEAHDAGEISEGEYLRALPPLRIGSPDATGVLVVPRPMTIDTWVNEEEDADCAARSNASATGPRIPERDRDPPRPKQPDPTYRTGQPAPKGIAARLKSLAGRKLRR